MGSSQKEQIDRDAKRLSDFIGTDDRFANLDSIEQELIREQCETMWQLSEIIGRRIARLEELKQRTDADQTSAIGGNDD